MGKDYTKYTVEIPQHILVAMLSGYWDDQCEIKIGEVVIKQNSELRDHHKNGTEGVVIGNINQPILGAGYYVKFGKDIPMFIIAKKVRRKSGSQYCDPSKN